MSTGESSSSGGGGDGGGGGVSGVTYETQHGLLKVGENESSQARGYVGDTG